jgi:glycosyltransferase involved in cell wall biosynthesis
VAEVRFVPFGIDPMWYRIKREESSEGPSKWLVVTRLTRAKLGPLFAWCAPLFDGQSRELHLFGPMQETIDLPDWVHYHGSASPNTLCRDWFPFAKGLITLSQHSEGRPQVMLEAMAAGLPIIATRLPAHEGIVIHGETGWLCDRQEDVAAGLICFENKQENNLAGVAAREWVSREVGTWDDCAERYAMIYQSLLTPSI